MPDGSFSSRLSDPNTTPDWPQVTPLIERLVGIAKGYGGEFLVTTVGSEDPKTGKKLVPLNLHVPNDDRAREGLLSAIKEATLQDGNNCYVGIALFRPGLTSTQKGKEADVVGVLAAVTDWDGKNDPVTRNDRLPMCPMAEIETSPGNFQCWYLFDRPYSVAEAKPVLTALARCTKSDNTHSCDHVFRVPGTSNWPSQSKIAKGRSPVPWRAQLTFMSDESWHPNLTLDGLRVAIAEKYPDALMGSDAPSGENHTGQGPKARRAKRQICSISASDGGEFDWAKALKSNYRPLADETVIKKLNVTDGDRSEIAYALIRKCASRGYTPQLVLDHLTRHVSLPVMRHYADHTGGFEKSLRTDIIRAFSKPDEPAPQSASKVFKACSQEETRESSASDRRARRQIKLIGDYLPSAVDDAEKALIEQGVDIFQRGSFIVRSAAAPRCHSRRCRDRRRTTLSGAAERNAGAYDDRGILPAL
jgi:RepB DNA-primase from phage plasmid